jgi:hypothetical protein
MADAQAWSEGWQIGSERAAEGRAHKQAMSDREFMDKHDEIQGMIDNLQTRLATLPKDTPDYMKIQDQLTQALQQRDQHWKSLDHPNAILKFGKMLGRDLRFKKQAPPTPVAPPVYAQPTTQIPASSADESVTLGSQPGYSEKTADAHGHIATSQQPGVSASTVNGLGATGEQPTTVKTGPAYKVEGPQTPAQMKAQAEALQLSSAAPLSPEEKSTQDARASAAGNLALIQGKLNNLDKLFPDAPQELRQSWRNELAASITGVKPTAEKYFSQLATTEEILPDGTKKLHYWRVPMADEAPEEVDFNGQVLQPKNPPKPGTSKFSVNVESYKKLHGIPADQDLTPDQLNFVEQQIALSSAAPSSNITNTLKQDVNGAWVPIQETTQRIPGFGTILRDPLGPVQNRGAGPAATGGAAPTPADVRAQAHALNPPAATPRHAGVNVGQPLFQGRTPEYTKAVTDLNAAVKLNSLADQVWAKPNDAINQKRLAVALEKMSAGRFTTQALDYIIKAGWGKTIEQWINNPSTGALPQDVVRQFVDGAHENLKAAQDAVNDLKATFPQGSGQNATSNPDIDAIVNILNNPTPSSAQSH